MKQGPTIPSQGKPAGDSRIAAIDVIRFAAIVAVVLQHSGPLRIWRESFSQFDVLRISWISYHVPAFLMVAGFLLARERLRLPDLQHRLVRVLVPYFIASMLVQLLGYSGAEGDPSRIAYQLVTGSSLNIYYYVFVYVLCTLAAWPLSYLGERLLWLLLALLYLYGFAAVLNPGWALAPFNVFVVNRNPLNFGLAYFLTGWVVSMRRETFARIVEQWRGPLRTFFGITIVVGIAIWATDQAVWMRQFSRPVYSLAVVGLIAVIRWRKPLPAAVSFLSECTLGIYLFHLLFLLPLLAPLMSWPPPLRTASWFGVAMAASCLLGWASRRLLGRAGSSRLLGF